MGLSFLLRHCILLAMGLAFAGSCAAQNAPVILVLGDSLSAEYGLKRGTGWVALLEQRLTKEKVNAKVVNASISGDTTTGGRSRLPALLTLHKPTVVVIELGGNDALRGLPLAMTQDNLQSMAGTARTSGAKVLLAGMQVPPNYGADYNARFARAYVDAAKAHKTALVPFFLQGVADRPDASNFFQADRIHPTEAAHPIILDTMWPAIRKLL